MKKFFFCLFLVSLFLPLAAQDVVVVDPEAEEVNEQYEQFSWEPVAKAKQYGVTIDKFDTQQEIWVDYKEIKTKDTQVEVLFTPGLYRVSICTYNLIGRKSKGSDWVQFKILEENIPYLNDKAFAKHSYWQVPTLYLNKSGENSLVELPNPDYINYITPQELFGPNAILVKGRNIFSPKTEFYLVPKDEGSGQPFVNYCDKRTEQKLNILLRNSKDYSVVVSYDPSKLQPGYYSLEVRNVGNNIAALDILVLDDNPLQLSPGNGFEVDEHYNVNSFTLANTESYNFSLLAKGVNSATSFYLEPTKGPVSYPFESELTRTSVPIQVDETFMQDSSQVKLSLSLPVQDLRTGYYNLVAKNWDGNSAKFLCLVKKPFDNDYTKKVSKLKTKYNKHTDIVDITFVDAKFSPDKTYTLVSEYDSKIDSNNRIPLTLTQSGKKLVGKLSPDKLIIAKYALIIEDAWSYDVIYCNVDNTLKLSMNKMNDSLIQSTFLRPVGVGNEVTLDADDTGSVQYFDNVVDLKKRMPPLFAAFRFDISPFEQGTVTLDAELDLLHFNYVAWSLGYDLKVIQNSSPAHGLYSMVHFSFNNDYFAPYLGTGLGINLVAPETGIAGFNDALSMFKNTDQIYGIAQIGVNLLTILDIRYNLYYNYMFSDTPYFSQSIALGTTFPLRSFKFKRKVLTRTAQISKAGAMNVSEFFDSSANVDSVIIIDSNSVGGFENYNNLERLTIGGSVNVIEENAFRDCKNLNTVVFDDRYNAEGGNLTIKSNAFANDRQIDVIYLPVRTRTVQSGAFANWTNGQNIILDWTQEDTTERNLIGLENCSATVHYKDGKLFTNSFMNALEDDQNWVSINEIDPETVSVYHEDNYKLGVRLRGYGRKWYKTELDSWINQTSTKEAIDFIQSGDTISFKVQGDGNSFEFILTSQDGGYFYYKFKTKEGEVTTVEIPYRKLKKYSYSSQKELDLNTLKMFCILPACKDEWNEVTFFDFEVKNEKGSKN